MNITIQAVQYAQIIDYIREITEAHWEEVPFGQYELDLDLHDTAYTYAEEQGYIRIYAAIVDSTVVGYISLAASEMMHHKGTMQAVTDSFYVEPEYRNSGVFSTLLNFVENDLRTAGIRFFTVGVNPTADTAVPTAQALVGIGYDLTEQSYTKEL